MPADKPTRAVAPNASSVPGNGPVGNGPAGAGPAGSGPAGPGAPGAADGSADREPGQPAGVRPAVRTGRNLPAALGVGLGMGGVVFATLLTVKATFLIYMGAVVGVAVWELSRALAGRDIRLPLLPVAAGGAAALPLTYWFGGGALGITFAVTVIAILAWRLPGGAAGYLRDVTAGVFALAYLPFLASFVALMLAAPDGAQRTLVFVILIVCSDVGGYFAGILLGRHPMAPVISPKKTWEGFGGSALACVLAGAIAVPTLLGGAIWVGVLVGAVALGAATLGDLAESMIKRDLEIKDMGTVLPGHGGVLDRIDSLLLGAPVIWLLLAVFIPASGGH